MISPSLQKKVSILIFSKVTQKNKRFNDVFKAKEVQLKLTLGSVQFESIVEIMI
jgi:hypothetical protein